jgi:hypothetical protein|tara:strand:+ start:3233 stop:3631 length:399 start_codon:yes stop_codon:yes gene_type:complete
MKKQLTTLLIASCLLSGTALADDDDCNDPVSAWQSREQLRLMIENKGWQVKRIKVDDGCYEVKGFDQKGNRVKATFSPASLKLRRLSIKFGNSGDASDYLDFGTPPTALKTQPTESNKPQNKHKNKPKVTID